MRLSRGYLVGKTVAVGPCSGFPAAFRWKYQHRGLKSQAETFVTILVKRNRA